MTWIWKVICLKSSTCKLKASLELITCICKLLAVLKILVWLWFSHIFLFRMTFTYWHSEGEILGTHHSAYRNLLKWITSYHRYLTQKNCIRHQKILFFCVMHRRRITSRVESSIKKIRNSSKKKKINCREILQNFFCTRIVFSSTSLYGDYF